MKSLFGEKSGDSSPSLKLRVRMTEQETQNDLLLCHPYFSSVTLRHKPKGLLPFLSFRGGKSHEASSWAKRKNSFRL